MPDTVRNDSPRCPRCGYDLSGHMASWKSACPVEGQCSECGLEFFWREILREDEQVNPRHIEHCPRRAIPLAAVRTFVWCILPWVFWKRMELRHEPRVGRMVLWLVLLLVSVHVLSSVLLAIAMWRVEARAISVFNADRLAEVPGIQREIAELDAQLESTGSTPRLVEYRDILGHSLSLRYKPIPSRGLRVGHLAIAIGYPFVLVDDGVIRRNRSLGATVPGPWAVELLPFWSNPAILSGLGFSLTFAIMLAILPQTRPRLRIRWVHLLRASVFGFAWLAVPSMLGMIESVSFIIDDLSSTQGRSPNSVLLVDTLREDWAAWCWVFIGWSAIWWLCAVWRGLRFPAPLFHWALLVIAAVLVSLGAIFLVIHPLTVGELLSPGNWFQHRRYSDWPLGERLLSGDFQRLR